MTSDVVAPEDRRLLDVLHDTVTAVADALAGLGDWDLVGSSDHQYRHDVVADAAATEVLRAAGLDIVSEESGAHERRGGVVVVVDPVDGSTNASRGIPWWNTSLCAVDDHGPRVAVVANGAAQGGRFEAVRGAGAWLDGRTIRPTGCERVGDAIIGLNGYPARHLGWKQYRALGATALDLCAVASGVLDGYVDCTRRGSAPWDYLGGLLVCREAGVWVADADGEDLDVTGFADRRTPIAAATEPLLDELLRVRRKIG